MFDQYFSRFDGCIELRLEQNYRSTNTIIRGCDSLIRRNTARRIKTIVCGQGVSHVGNKIHMIECRSAIVEAAHVATCIQTLLNSNSGCKCFQKMLFSSLRTINIFILLVDLVNLTYINCFFMDPFFYFF